MDIILLEPSPAGRSGGVVGQMRQAMVQEKGAVVVYSRDPEEEQGEVAAAVGLLRQRPGGEGVIIGATPHPTLEWWQRMVGMGTSGQWATEDPVAGEGEKITQRVDIQTPPCPHLHCLADGKGPLSVCGQGKDRVVLALPHFRQWCLKEGYPCPYWQH